MSKNRPTIAACALIWLLVASSPGAPQSPASWRHDQTGSFNQALGMECLDCHAPQGSGLPAPPRFPFAQRMVSMVQGLNDGRLKPFGGVTCWTCHRGRAKPPRLPTESWEAVQAEHSTVFVGPRTDYAVTMSVYAASLGVGCEHCHELGAWAKDSKRQKRIAREMAGLFDEIPTYFEATRMPRLQCFMCHQGEKHPQRARPE